MGFKELNLASCLAWDLYYMSITNGLPPVQLQGPCTTKSEGAYSTEYYQVDQKAAIRNEGRNFCYKI